MCLWNPRTYMRYRLILSLRNARYKGGRHSVKAPVPTICVGNITVGGTGKTPHCEMILRLLLDSARWGSRNIALLSRGYKRRSKGFQEVLYNGSAAMFGDEPLQIKRKFPPVVTAVCKDRVAGCEALAKDGAELIVLDDAYQYRKLKADLDIVLTPYDRPVSEDSLLPFGRLRDLPKRLYDADIVIVSKCPYVLDPEDKSAMARTLGFDTYDPDTCIATRPSASRAGRKAGKADSCLLLFTGINYDRPTPVFEQTDSRYIYSHKIVLFSGIADDTPLRNYLSDSYKIVEHLHFPDHHAYTKADLRVLRKAIKHNPTAAFATTEKDAQRLRDLPQMPRELLERLFYFPISVDFFSERERELFTEKLTTL